MTKNVKYLAVNIFLDFTLRVAQSKPKIAW